MHQISGFCIYSLKTFPRVILPDPRRSDPAAWTQTPISAWLASVSIAPALRNDQLQLTCFNVVGRPFNNSQLINCRDWGFLSAFVPYFVRFTVGGGHMLLPKWVKLEEIYPRSLPPLDRPSVLWTAARSLTERPRDASCSVKCNNVRAQRRRGKGGKEKEGGHSRRVFWRPPYRRLINGSTQLSMEQSPVGYAPVLRARRPTVLQFDNFI